MGWNSCLSDNWVYHLKKNYEQGFTLCTVSKCSVTDLIRSEQTWRPVFAASDQCRIEAFKLVPEMGLLRFHYWTSDGNLLNYYVRERNLKSFGIAHLVQHSSKSRRQSMRLIHRVRYLVLMCYLAIPDKRAKSVQLNPFSLKTVRFNDTRYLKSVVHLPESRLILLVDNFEMYVTDGLSGALRSLKLDVAVLNYSVLLLPRSEKSPSKSRLWLVGKLRNHVQEVEICNRPVKSRAKLRRLIKRRK